MAPPGCQTDPRRSLPLFTAGPWHARSQFDCDGPPPPTDSFPSGSYLVVLSDSGSRMGASAGAQVRLNAVIEAACSFLTSLNVCHQSTR